MNTNIEWLWPDTPISVDSIRQVENQLKISLPSDFVQHIQSFNGGYPDKNRILVEGNGERILNNLISLKLDSENNVLETINNLDDQIPKNLVPFGADPAGNFFCFNYSTTPPQIYFWDHEISNDGQIAIYKICSDFSSFVKLLY